MNDMNHNDMSTNSQLTKFNPHNKVHSGVRDRSLSILLLTRNQRKGIDGSLAPDYTKPQKK